MSYYCYPSLIAELLGPRRSTGETAPAPTGVQRGVSYECRSSYDGGDNYKLDSNPTEPVSADQTAGPWLNWDEVVDFAPNDLVFLGALDFSESSGLFPDASGWRRNETNQTPPLQGQDFPSVYPLDHNLEAIQNQSHYWYRCLTS